jgi:hypothetical protein
MGPGHDAEGLYISLMRSDGLPTSQDIQFCRACNFPACSLVEIVLGQATGMQPQQRGEEHGATLGLLTYALKETETMLAHRPQLGEEGRVHQPHKLSRTRKCAVGTRAISGPILRTFRKGNRGDALNT